MLTRLSDFLDKNNIIYKHQFGFEKNKLTTQAVFDLYTRIVGVLEGTMLVVCFWTLQKHLILLTTKYCDQNSWYKGNCQKVVRIVYKSQASSTSRQHPFRTKVHNMWSATRKYIR